ncbi:Cd(II)/Pb(II)-responsive transcriptional regulator [Citrifermentans bremense]|uniref:Cd(II)/Pb(II)-responsive transcriptional regulator n=1 Tax=Citrifermentans bremense TaxID=60035 RepID=UPI000553A824|nr:Cd(II)/Pb(II)-responsive transcriptional regulator [Citrifermentans bremense]
MSNCLKIGEVARMVTCRIETIRYYEQQGLLPTPGRSEGNYRLYGREHVERLRFIRHCRSLDMTLDNVKLLLKFRDAPEENCGPVDALLDEHIGHVADRIVQLKLLEAQLRDLRGQCLSAKASKDCRILQALSPGKER